VTKLRAGSIDGIHSRKRLYKRGQSQQAPKRTLVCTEQNKDKARAEADCRFKAAAPQVQKHGIFDGVDMLMGVNPNWPDF
jgi:hypothetical protein